MSSHEEIYKQYISTRNTRVIFSFKGMFSQEILTEFGSMIRTSLQAETKLKKIFGVFIEISQNILYYSDEKAIGAHGEESGVGIVIFEEDDTKYTIESGNLIKKDKVERIRGKIEHINSLDRDKLKSYYQEQLRQERPEDSKGAGIGLIDIARKSDYPLGFGFTEVDENFNFYTMAISFKKEG
ncbi:MAG: SiaB family protein kinase [Leptospira sp.]|nr:SiaB family protein kinase [Leptospira sp.]